MKRLVLLLILLAVGCFAQDTPATSGNAGVLLDQRFAVGSSLSGVLSVASGQFAGMNNFVVEFTPLSGSNLTSCTLFVDSSLDGHTWTQGGAIPSQTCTAQGYGTGQVTTNNVRVDLSLQGTGQVRVRLLGKLSIQAMGGALLFGPTGCLAIAGANHIISGTGTLTSYGPPEASLVVTLTTGAFQDSNYQFIPYRMGPLTNGNGTGQLYPVSKTNNSFKFSSSDTTEGGNLVGWTAIGMGPC